MLAESTVEMAQRVPAMPRWVEYVCAASRRDDAIEPSMALDRRLQEPVGAFLELVRPFIYLARENLELRSRSNLRRLFTPDATMSDAWAPLVAELGRRLLTGITRTVVLEINVARLEGRLAGDTPESRYESFLDLLGKDGYRRNLLQEYPALAKYIASVCRNWETANGEFLTRLDADLTRLREVFSLRPDDLVARLQYSDGDCHRGGRSVMICEFLSGARVVYKPRPVQAESAFAALCTWISPFLSTALHPARVLDMGPYGWMEYIEHTPCETNAEIGRYYFRQGMYLALLHAIDAEDMHFENLIASGENPVLIDLETVFTAELIDELLEPTVSSSPARRSLASSVFRVGMLPSSNAADIEVGALGGEGEQWLFGPRPEYEGIGTDSPRVVKRRVPFSSSSHRPTLSGAYPSASEFVDEIVGGFSHCYRVICEQKGPLLAGDGPIAAFSDCTIRLVPRTTVYYASTLIESVHPDFLRDGLSRDRYLDKLWSVVTKHPNMRVLIAAERRDILAGDIPYFNCTAGGRDLCGSDGEPVGFRFEKSGLERVSRKISSMSGEDLHRQSWMVRAAFSTTAALERLFQEGHRDDGAPVPGAPEGPIPTDYATKMATAAARRMELLFAVAGGTERLSWLGLSPLSSGRWNVDVMGVDLYDGGSGIAIFLAYLGTTLNGHKPGSGSRWLNQARDTLQSVIDKLERLRADDPAWARLGGYTGTGGIVYALSHLSRLLNDDGLLDLAACTVARSAAHVKSDVSLDIIDGLAGFVAGGVSLYSVRPDPGILDTLVDAGDRMIQLAHRRDGRAWWDTPHDSVEPMCGFAHGASGMAFALLRLAVATDNAKYLDVAIEAMRYEHAARASHGSGWPDYRTNSMLAHPLHQHTTSEHPSVCAWCHGAAGIGLVRAYAVEIGLDLDWLEDDLRFAMSATRDGGGQNNLSLCHGNLGNLDLFLKTRRLSPGNADIEAILASCHRSCAAGIWPCGTPNAIETPGLMLGLSGIGFGFLRAHAPDKVPSILTFDVPPTVPPRVTPETSTTQKK